MTPSKRRSTSATLIKVALVLSFTTSPPLHAEIKPEDDVQKVYELFKNGQAPTLSPKEFHTEREELDRKAERFSERWDTSLITQSDRCQRFSTNLSNTIAILRETLNNLPPPSSGNENPKELQAKVMVHLLVPALFTQHSLFINGADGGFGSLDVKDRIQCERRDKSRLVVEFNELVRSVSHFHLQGVGNPGLNGFDRLISDLLVVAEKNENTHKKVSLTIIGASVIASLLLWEFAPVWFAKAMAMGGFESAATMGPWTAFGVRSAAIASETMALQYTENKLNPPPVERQPQLTGDWDEKMRDIETIFQHGDSPEAAISFLNQIRSQYVALFAPWLDKHLKESPPDLAPTLALTKETLALGNLPISDASVAISDLVLNDFGYRISCDSNWWSGLTEIQCLRGIRTLAHVIYKGEIFQPRSTVGDLLNFQLTSETDSHVVYDDKQAHVNLPYYFDENLVSDALASVQQGQGLRKLVSVTRKFEAYRENVHLNLGIDLDFDPSLSMGERWNSLVQLRILASAEMPVFERPAEVFYITRGFRGLHESKMRLTESLAANADAVAIESFLKNNVNQARDTVLVTKVTEERQRIADLQQNLHNQANLNVQCSPLAQLTNQECMSTLERLSTYVNERSQPELSIRKFLITSSDEPAGAIVNLEDDEEPIFVLHSDFEFASLDRLQTRKGHLP